MNSSTLKFYHWNVRGLTYTKSSILFNLSTQTLADFIFISETWHSNATKVLSSKPPQHWKLGQYSHQNQIWTNTRQHGGLALFYHERLDRFSPSFFADEYWIAIKIFGFVFAAVYFPPSISTKSVLLSLHQILALGPLQALVGDLNVRLGEMSMDSSTFPFERAEVIHNFIFKNHLSWKALPQLALPDLPDRIQHLFIGDNVVPFNLNRISQTFSNYGTLSDHPILTFGLRLPVVLTNRIPTIATNSDSEPPSSRQFYFKFLDNTETQAAMQGILQKAWTTLPSEEDLINLGKKWIFETPESFHGKSQLLVSELNTFIESSIIHVAEQFLGSYDISKIRKQTISSADYLHQSGRGSASLRLYKQSLRGSGITASSIIASRDPEISAEEDCLQFYKEIYSKRPGMMNSFTTTSSHSQERKEMIRDWKSTAAWKEKLSMEDISKALKQYPTAKAKGVDGISPILLKKLDSNGTITLALKLLFNACIFFGQTPSHWNMALISTIPKDIHDSGTVDKRRPISVTLMIRRIFEKSYLERMKTSINGEFGPANYPLYPGQAGFRKNFSTYSNVLSLHEAVIRGNSQIAFVDLKQAYDRVDVEKLLAKLTLLGLCSRFRNLVRSLYTGGSAVILVNGKLTQPFEKYSGLMQGGLWSPLLFSFYIDDLSEKFLSLRNQFTIPLKMFADDIAVVRPGNQITSQFQGDLLSIEDWCKENSMAINVKKSAIIDSIKNSEKTGFYLSDGSSFSVVSEYKYLGFPFTKNGINLIALLQMGTTKGQLAFQTAKLSSITWPQWMRFYVYQSFIRSRWEYGAPLIYQALISNPSKLLLEQFKVLEKLDDECFKWIFGGNWKNRVDIHTRNLLGSTSLKGRFAKLHCKFVSHLQEISSAGTELHMVLQKVKAEVLPCTSSMLSRLLFNSEYQSYLKQSEKWYQKPSDWIVDGVKIRRWKNNLFPKEPPDISLHLQLLQQVQYQKHSAMMSLIRRGARIGQGFGPDFSIFIPLPAVRALAIQWRLGNFCHKYQCPEHKAQMSRTCIHQCQLLQDCTDLTSKYWTRFYKSEQDYLQESNVKKAGCYTILDDLLNFRDWKLFAFSIYFLLTKITNSSYSGARKGTIDRVELDLLELNQPYYNPLQTIDKWSPPDNG